MYLKHSFWLIAFHINSIDYIAFSIDGVLYRFEVVPYGLQSSCAALVKALHIISNKYEDLVLHYVDDILIISNDEKNYLKQIKIVLNQLSIAGLKINIGTEIFFFKAR